jgi:uridine phosphorylase
MEFHIKCDPSEIARYVFAPGDQARAEKIAKHFDEYHLVTLSRGYSVYSGTYKGVHMTACGMGMGGPTLAIGMHELANMGADTFIRVGSCGVMQPGQKTGDVVIASGTVRLGGTGNAYLPPFFPAVPTFTVLRTLVEAGEELGLPTTVGVGGAGDAFYGPRDSKDREGIMKAGLVFGEMESDTLFIVGSYNGWRTGALFASDGDPGKMKPEEKEAVFREGEQNMIKIAVHAAWKLAEKDNKTK